MQLSSNSRRVRVRTLGVAAAIALAVAALAGIAVGSRMASPPTVRAVPTIEGEAREGRTLTARPGQWGGSPPPTFTYSWRRCDANGNNCVALRNATAQTYTLVAADVNHTMRVRVTARNRDGSATAVSRPTPVVVAANSPLPPGTPAGAVRLPDGSISIPATSVTPPHRLVISRVQFDPPVVRSRRPFLGRFRITDTRGFVVRDVLVYALGLPYSWLDQGVERTTDTGGWANIELTPTARTPLQNGRAIVMFVRARKVGDDLLAGVSSRRLVQVRLARPL